MCKSNTAACCTGDLGPRSGLYQGLWGGTRLPALHSQGCPARKCCWIKVWGQRGGRPLLTDLRGDHETHNGTQWHKGVKTWGFGDSPLGQNRLTITRLAKASAQVQAKTFRTGEGVRAKWFAFRVRTSSIVWNGAVTSILKVTKTCLFPWHRSHAREWLISQRLWSQQWIYIRQVGLQNSGG